MGESNWQCLEQGSTPEEVGECCFFFFFLLIIQSSSLFSYYCGTWCCLYWVVLIFLPCSDLMWCPRRAEVISSLIPPFFLFPHFCKGAWERALSEGASPICMYITAIYVCLFFCVMSALQKLSNISFFPRQGPSIFSLCRLSLSLLESPLFPRCTVFALLRTLCALDQIPTVLPQNKMVWRELLAGTDHKENPRNASGFFFSFFFSRNTFEIEISEEHLTLLQTTDTVSCIKCIWADFHVRR